MTPLYQSFHYAEAKGHSLPSPCQEPDLSRRASLYKACQQSDLASA